MVFPFPVRVHLPLEQGLRLSFCVCCVFSQTVRVHLPLEQGLRLTYDSFRKAQEISASASSIRTRIKTWYWLI